MSGNLKMAGNGDSAAVSSKEEVSENENTYTVSGEMRCEPSTLDETRRGRCKCTLIYDSTRQIYEAPTTESGPKFEAYKDTECDSYESSRGRRIPSGYTLCKIKVPEGYTLYWKNMHYQADPDGYVRFPLQDRCKFNFRLRNDSTGQFVKKENSYAHECYEVNVNNLEEEKETKTYNTEESNGTNESEVTSNVSSVQPEYDTTLSVPTTAASGEKKSDNNMEMYLEPVDVQSSEDVPTSGNNEESILENVEESDLILEEPDDSQVEVTELSPSDVSELGVQTEVQCQVVTPSMCLDTPVVVSERDGLLRGSITRGAKGHTMLGRTREQIVADAEETFSNLGEGKVPVFLTEFHGHVNHSSGTGDDATYINAIASVANKYNKPVVILIHHCYSGMTDEMMQALRNLPDGSIVITSQDRRVSYFNPGYNGNLDPNNCTLRDVLGGVGTMLSDSNNLTFGVKMGGDVVYGSEDGTYRVKGTYRRFNNEVLRDVPLDDNFRGNSNVRLSYQLVEYLGSGKTLADCATEPENNPEYVSNTGLRGTVRRRGVGIFGGGLLGGGRRWRRRG